MLTLNPRRGRPSLKLLLSLSLLAAAATLSVVVLPRAGAIADETSEPPRIAGYWADWEYWYNSDFTHDKVDFSRLTHVNYAFAWNDENGTIYLTDRHLFGATGDLGASSFSGGPGGGSVKCSPPFWHPFSGFDSSRHEPVCQGWNDHNSGFVKSVHDGGAKAILSIGGWTLSHKVSEMLESPTARANFVASSAALITDWGFDGIDLDFEYPGYAPHGGRPADKANYVRLLQELQAEFATLEITLGREIELTAAVTCGTFNADNAYDYPNVVANLDYINLMSYDLGGDWDPVAQHNSPLYTYDGHLNAAFSADGCVDHWIDNGAPRDKLVLGMAHYGRAVGGARAIGEPHTGHDSANWSTGDTEIRYYVIHDKMLNDPSFHTAYDADAATHYGWFDGGGFISFEDTTSIGQRSQYVIDEDLAGVLIWQLHGGMIDVDGSFTYPLLDAAVGVLHGATSPTTTTSTTNPPDTTTSPTTTSPPTSTPSANACEPFVQPYAHTPPYQTGDTVLFDGQGYTSQVDNNSWSPAAAPQLWASAVCDAVGPSTTTTTTPPTTAAPPTTTPSTTPAPTTTSTTTPDGATCTPFVQPYAGDPAYQVGDKVAFNGRTYESTFSPNWWSPAAAPQYWIETTCP